MIASVAANAGWNSTQTLIEKKLHSNLYNCKFKKACVSERRPSDEKNTSVWCSKESFVKTCIHFEKCVHLLQKSCFQKMLWDKQSCVSDTGKSKLALSSARRVTGNHPEATSMPMLKGRLGANCPFRTAIALSKRPKPRRTSTEAPLNGLTA